MNPRRPIPRGDSPSKVCREALIDSARQQVLAISLNQGVLTPQLVVDFDHLDLGNRSLASD